MNLTTSDMEVSKDKSYESDKQNSAIINFKSQANSIGPQKRKLSTVPAHESRFLPNAHVKINEENSSVTGTNRDPIKQMSNKYSIHGSIQRDHSDSLGGKGGQHTPDFKNYSTELQTIAQEKPLVLIKLKQAAASKDPSIDLSQESRKKHLVKKNMHPLINVGQIITQSSSSMETSNEMPE